MLFMRSESYRNTCLGFNTSWIIQLLRQVRYVQNHNLQFRAVKNWIFSWSRNIFNPLIYHIFNPLVQSAIRWVPRCSAWSADQRTPLHEYKITHESQHAHTVMEKVDSTPRHSWLHSSCLVAQQENSSPPRLSESDFPPAPQRWINQTNFRPELIHTFHTTLGFLFLFQ